MSSLYLYSMGSKTEELLTVRMDTETYLEFQAACKLRGASMSSIVHQYAVSVIYEERGKHSQRFSDEVEKFREALKIKRDAANAKKAVTAKKTATTAAPVYGLQDEKSGSVSEVVNSRSVIDIARVTGYDKLTVYKILAGDREGIDSRKIETVMNLSNEKTNKNVTPIDTKIAKGR